MDGGAQDGRKVKRERLRMRDREGVGSCHFNGWFSTGVVGQGRGALCRKGSLGEATKQERPAVSLYCPYTVLTHVPPPWCRDLIQASPGHSTRPRWTLHDLRAWRCWWVFHDCRPSECWPLITNFPWTTLYWYISLFPFFELYCTSNFHI